MMKRVVLTVFLQPGQGRMADMPLALGPAHILSIEFQADYNGSVRITLMVEEDEMTPLYRLNKSPTTR